MPAIRSSRKSSVKASAKASPPLKGIAPCSAWWCTKTFNRNPDMEKHANHKHLGVYYKCTECGYKAAQKDAVETHASNMHTHKKTSVCGCGKSFTDPSMLSRHRKEDGHDIGRSRREPSGLVIRGREPGTAHLTHALLADTSYMPAIFAEDTFTFEISSDAPSDASSDESSSPSSSTLSTPLPLLSPTSMSSSYSTEFMISSTPSPKRYEPTAPITPEVQWSPVFDYSPQSSLSFDEFSLCELNPQQPSFDFADYSSFSQPTLPQQPAFDFAEHSSFSEPTLPQQLPFDFAEYSSFSEPTLNYFSQSQDLCNFAGLNIGAQTDFVESIQENFLQQMASLQNTQLDFNQMPQLYPVDGQAEFSFEHDLNAPLYF